MKRFDAEAIKARLMERMRVKEDWALLSEDGTVSALLDTFADSEAELARYMEYLLGEKKWTTAQNISSLNTQTGLIGRKSHRSKSATGYVVISHTDASGVNRLANYGQTFFNLDDRSNYDNITPDTVVTDVTRTQALVPWTHDVSYVVPKLTRFISAKGIEFISTETMAIRALRSGYDTFAGDATLRQNFLASGGWNGIKYLKIPVIQGIQKTYIFGNAAGGKFETFLLPIANCEDASNNISKSFLHIYVNSTPTVLANREEWVQVPNILLAGPFDKVYEVINLPDYSGVMFKFGNGISGQLLPANAQVSCEYLETEGSRGNIDKKYQITSIIFPNGIELVDPRTGNQTSFLSVTNTTPIFGGADEESESDLRVNAPTEYLKHYAIATTSAYEEQIRLYSQIGLNKVKVFPGSSASTLSVGNVSVTSSQNVLYITAISSNGTLIDDPENQFMIPVTKAIGDLKAPSDMFAYIEPNFIRMRLNTIVHSDSPDISDEELKIVERQALTDKYSVYNMNFKETFHNSEYIALAQSFPFVSHVTAFPEAVADVDIDEAGLRKIETRGEFPTLYAVKFSFDTIFAQNLYYQGFHNYKQGAPYLLRVDLKIKNDPVKASIKNRTFFVFDDRNLYEGAVIPDLNDAKYLTVAGAAVVTNGSMYSDWIRPKETVDPDRFTSNGRPLVMFNRAARVAQYPLITSITDAKMMLSQIKALDREPYEIRPYITDALGNSKIFNITDVAEADRQLLSPLATQCYKKDSRYINYFDILFTEEYQNPEDPDYASGEIIFPASFFEFTNINIEDTTQFLSAMRNFVSLKVYARPLAEDFEPAGWNEIIFSEDEDIVVERVRTSSTL